MKLIKVTVEVELVMCVPDDSNMIDTYYVKEAISDTEISQHNITTEELTNIKQLPPEWEGACLPYRGNYAAYMVNEEKTIGEILEEQK